jgi:hypothetical protein
VQSKKNNADQGTKQVEPDQAILEGILRLDAFEVARLDNDPSFPENGILELEMGGGR